VGFSSLKIHRLLVPLQRDGYERAFSKRHQRSYWRVAVPIVEQSLLPLLPWVVAAASATLVVDVGGSTPGGDGTTAVSWEYVEPENGAALLREIAWLAAALNDVAQVASGHATFAAAADADPATAEDEVQQRQAVIAALEKHAHALAGVAGTVTGRMLIDTSSAVQAAAEATAAAVHASDASPGAAALFLGKRFAAAAGHAAVAVAVVESRDAAAATPAVFAAAIAAALDLVGTAPPADATAAGGAAAAADAALRRCAIRLEAHIAPSAIARSSLTLANLERAAAAAALHSAGALHLVLDGDGVTTAAEGAPALGTPWWGCVHVQSSLPIALVLNP
jgi:hypothetical protein